jgi:hypothetical protein
VGEKEGSVMARAPKKRKRGSIEGPFAWRLVEMLESPAYRVLSLSAHRIMARLEIEMAYHGGKPEENGRLPCTFEHFVEFGVHRHAIAPAIRELVALGFVEITRKGCAGNAGFRQPTLYRLTYRHCGSHKETTDEWKMIETMKEAEAIAEMARSPRSESGLKNKSPVPETITGASDGNRTNRGSFPVPETITTGPVPETITTSISPGVEPPSDRVDDPTQPSLAPPLADVLLPDCPPPPATPPIRLVWKRPLVRELFGKEALTRRAELEGPRWPLRSNRKLLADVARW